MFKHMDIEEQNYKLGAPCKTTTRTDANRVSHVGKRKRK